LAAEAIYDHYKPESADDEIPRSIEGCLLTMADKLDTIAGMFALDLIPTGSRDPFALRRAGNGIVKMLAEWPVKQKRGLNFISKKAISPFGTEIAYWAAKDGGGSGDSSNPLEDTERLKIPVDQKRVTSQMVEFLTERLGFYLKEVGGFAYDVVNAVLRANADVAIISQSEAILRSDPEDDFAEDAGNLAVPDDLDVRDAIARAEALTAVRGSEDFLAISAAFKRIKNILRQAAEKGELVSQTAVSESALTQPEERKLLADSTQLAAKVTELREQRNYAAALEAIATLRPTVDAFFDKIMVMAPEPELRAARLALIQSVLDGFSGIADFSEIVVA